MTYNDLPSVNVETIDGTRLMCGFERSKSIGENWIGVLISKDLRFLWGRFVDVNIQRKNCTFLLETEDDSHRLGAERQYKYLDGHNGDIAQIILANPRPWKQYKFKASDAAKIPGGWRPMQKNEILEKDDIIPGGWDHEHCKICWYKVTEDNPDCYFDEVNFLCIECHQRYVIPADLGIMDLYE